MPDPIADYLARTRQPEPELESVDDLRGTVFDDSDPIAQWRRQAAPKQDSLGPIGRGIRSAFDFATKPVRAIAEPLEANADYLTGSIPETETPGTGFSPLSYLKAFGAGVNKTIAGMASPAGAASFMGGPIGVGGRAVLASQQIPQGVSETAAGVRARDPWKAAGGMADVALGTALVAGDVGSRVKALRQPAAVDAPLSPGFWESYDRTGRRGGDDPAAAARRALPPAPNGPAGGESYDELDRLFLPAGPEPAPPSYPIDTTPPLLPSGEPTRFYAGDAGARDAWNGPIEAPTVPRGTRGLLPARASDAAIGMPGRPAMALDDYLAEARLKPGDPLADLETQLYPPPAEQPPFEQPPLYGPGDVTPAPRPPRPPAGPAPAGAANVETSPVQQLRGAGGASGNRTLVPGAEKSVDDLDELYNALGYTDERPLPGNGILPAETPVSPAAPDAAPAGELPPGGSRELPAAPQSGLEPARGGKRGTARGRTAKPGTAEPLDELIADARANGYEGSDDTLRTELETLLGMDDQINGEMLQGGRNPENLLRKIQELGGIGEGPAAGGQNLLGTSLQGDPYAGEVRWLREFQNGPFGQVNGIQRIFNKIGQSKAGSRVAGKTLSQMVEALQQEPGFEHIQNADDLITELRAAAGAELPKKDVFGALERMGVKYGEPWWKKVGEDDSFDVADANQWADAGANELATSADRGEREFLDEIRKVADDQPAEQPIVDTLDTGEQQPRLPGGDVAAKGGGSTAFRAPQQASGEDFRLGGPEPPSELEQSLFGGEQASASGELASLDDLLTRHDVRNPAKADEIAASMQRVGWKGRPILVINDGGQRTAWTGTHRLEGAKRAGLSPADVPMVEVDGQTLRAAGYDPAELAQLGKKQRIQALRAAGQEDAAALLEDERAAAQQRRSAEPAVDVPEDVPPNVRDYLVRQLGYTPEEVAALGSGEARRIGREQVAHPEREARRAPAPPAPIEPLPERGQLPSMRNFDELRTARGQQRIARLKRGAVHPEEPGSVEGGPMPKTPAERAAAGEPLTAKERQALNLPEEPREQAPRSSRAQGASPRQVERRVQRLDAWMEDPTPENFARWVDEISGQAERVNERQLRGGTGEEGTMPKRTESGEYLAGSPFPGFQVLADPRILKKLAQFLVSNESADRLLRGAAFGAVGAMTNEDHRLRGAVYGAVAGMMGPEVARAVAHDFVTLAKGEVPKGLAAVYNQRQAGDIGILENLFGSKARTIPEQFGNVRPAIDALDDIRKTGKVDSRLPLTERLDAGAPAFKDGKLQIRQGAFLKPEIAYLREEATKAAAKGKPRMASYLNAYAEELAGTMTRSEKALRDMGFPLKGQNRTSTEVANQVYRNGLAFNVASAAVNRISQPLLTAPYVGLRNLWKNYAPLSEAEKGLSDITRPIDISETPRAALTALQKFDDISSSLMRFTDNHNRQGAYAAAHLAAEQAGATTTEAFRFARDVSEKTQGLLGLLSGNPRWRGPVIKTIKPFTKYPILFTEWLNDVATSPDPRVRWRTAAMAAGVWSFSQLTGVDAFDMLAGGARYGGSAMLRGAMDLYAHATNQAKDHKLAALPGNGLADSDLGSIVYPVGIRKVVDTAGRFAHQGLGTHKTRTPSGALEEVSPLEDLLNVFGVRTTRQTDRQKMLDDAHAHELAAAEADSQETAQAKRDFLRAMDAGNTEAAQDALSKMPPNTRRSVLKTQNRDRFERLLHATPRKRRPALLDSYGELENTLRGER